MSQILLRPHLIASNLLLLIVFVLRLAQIDAAAQTPSFAAGVENGSVNTYELSEASGLVASRQNPGVLWTHNDSSYRGSVFALATNGAYLARYDIPAVFFGDFEDIAIGPGPLPHFQYIYLGDIGDNFRIRDTIRVFRFPEPSVYHFQSNAPVVVSALMPQIISLSYPDGPLDAESMFVDPLTGDLFIATKEADICRLFRATRAELDSGGTVPLTFIRQVSFRSASAADISADGSLIAIRRGSRASLWVRAPGDTVADALARAPLTIPVIGQEATPPEPNGEAIAFDATVSGYFTLSEGSLQPLYYFARTGTPPRPPRVFIAPGAEWGYDDGSAPPPASWRTNLVAAWLPGVAPFGYGGSEQTTVFGDEFFPTIYFRNVFTNSGSVSNLALRIAFNDGVVATLNGTEILRRNLPADAIDTTFATEPNLEQARYWYSVPVNPALLRTGTNVVAVEVHHAEGSPGTMNFDLQLVEGNVESPPVLKEVRLTADACEITVTGPAGLRVDLESTADFETWILERSLVLTNGVATFSSTATNGARFFRTRQ